MKWVPSIIKDFSVQEERDFHEIFSGIGVNTAGAGYLPYCILVVSLPAVDGKSH